MSKRWKRYTNPVGAPRYPSPGEFDELPDLIEENSITNVPYHPQVQFLKDVDGDGHIDHMYCCEAASLEYLNSLGEHINPLELERHDTLVEYTHINPIGPDAGWGAAILALVKQKRPYVYGPSKIPTYWAAAYRIPVKGQQMKAKEIEVNHDLVTIGIDDKYVYLHCTYNGPCAVTRENYNNSVLMLTTIVDHEPPSKPLPPDKTVEYLLDKTNAPVVTTVNAHMLNPIEKMGTLPFIVTVEKSWEDDWVDGLTQPMPPAKDDRICYLYAVVKNGEIPIYNAKDDWLKWLENNEDKIINP